MKKIKLKELEEPEEFISSSEEEPDEVLPKFRMVFSHDKKLKPGWSKGIDGVHIFRDNVNRRLKRKHIEKQYDCDNDFDDIFIPIAKVKRKKTVEKVKYGKSCDDEVDSEKTEVIVEPSSEKKRKKKKKCTGERSFQDKLEGSENEMLYTCEVSLTRCELKSNGTVELKKDKKKKVKKMTKSEESKSNGLTSEGTTFKASKSKSNEYKTSMTEGTSSDGYRSKASLTDEVKLKASKSKECKSKSPRSECSKLKSLKPDESKLNAPKSELEGSKKWKASKSDVFKSKVSKSEREECNRWKASMPEESKSKVKELKKTGRPRGRPRLQLFKRIVVFKKKRHKHTVPVGEITSENNDQDLPPNLRPAYELKPCTVKLTRFNDPNEVTLGYLCRQTWELAPDRKGREKSFTSEDDVGHHQWFYPFIIEVDDDDPIFDFHHFLLCERSEGDYEAIQEEDDDGAIGNEDDYLITTSSLCEVVAGDVVQPKKLARFDCIPCKKQFFHAATVIQHMRTLHRKSKLWSKCNECGKEYRTLFRLSQHMNRHIGYKPFKCVHCPRAFLDFWRLKYHITCIHKQKRKSGKRWVNKRKYKKKEKLPSSSVLINILPKADNETNKSQVIKTDTIIAKPISFAKSSNLILKSGKRHQPFNFFEQARQMLKMIG